MPAMTKEEVYGLVEEIVGHKVEDLAAEFRKQESDRMGQLLEARTAREDNRPAGQLASRCVQALVLGKGDPEKARSIAAKRWEKDEELIASFDKALAAGDATAGGFLVPETISMEIIEFLRAESVVRAMNPVNVDLSSGTVRIPRQTAGASGQWIGENQNLPVTQPAFGQIVMTAKKYGAVVPISNDLLRRSSPDTDMLVRDDLVRDIRIATDLAFIRGDGLGGQPKGLLNFGTQTASAGTSLDNVTNDLAKAIERILNANAPIDRAGWVLAPRSWRALSTMRDGNNNLVWKPEMDMGTLMGFPFRRTTQVPTNLGGGSNESEIYFAAFSQVLVGDTQSLIINVSDTAAYHDGTNVVSAFSLDQTVVRAIVEVDLNVRHAASVQIITGVTWGA